MSIVVAGGEIFSIKCVTPSAKSSLIVLENKTAFAERVTLMANIWLGQR